MKEARTKLTNVVKGWVGMVSHLQKIVEKAGKTALKLADIIFEKLSRQKQSKKVRHIYFVSRTFWLNI